MPSFPRRLMHLAAGALCAWTLAACGGSDDSPTRIETRLGVLEGADDAASGTRRWLGIPYAQPPVGARRWMPPVPAAAWTGVREAKAFGHACIQAGRFYSPAPDDAPFGLAVRDSLGRPVGSEDCLTLNIWRPATNAKSLPVIVFIHGGSNISGYTADPLYDGATLARAADAVVVTLNYRLGLFGWLDIPQLKTGEPLADSGNFANLDHVEALKWVREHIAAFGGNPGNVTLMGQSAGAVDVWAAMVSPLTPGLFHKAAPLSGGMLFTPPAAARAFGEKFLQALAVADGHATDAAGAQAWLATRTAQQVADWLRGKEAGDLLRVQIANAATLGAAPAVFTDGAVVAAAPAAAIAAGQYRQVPLLVGNTRDEGKLFGPYRPNDRDRFTMQYQFNPDAAPTLTESDLLQPQMLPVTAPGTGWNDVSARVTNGLFLAGAQASLAAVQARQSDIWVYRFDWDEAPVPFDTVYGAAHAMDLPFVFGNFGKSVVSFAFSQANRPGRQALAGAMMGSVAAFARSGSPNHAGLGLAWSPWPSRLVFDASPAQLQLQLAQP